MIVCMNPLHKDNIYPMDKAMELIYEEYGKGDALVQVEALEYMPGNSSVMILHLIIYYFVTSENDEFLTQNPLFTTFHLFRHEEISTSKSWKTFV